MNAVSMAMLCIALLPSTALGAVAAYTEYTDLRHYRLAWYVLAIKLAYHFVGTACMWVVTTLVWVTWWYDLPFCVGPVLP